MIHHYVDNYYDYVRGWNGTNPQWYTVTINNHDSAKHTAMVKWLYDRIDNPERHCRWISASEGSSFRFRYEKNFILFRLTWE